MVASLEKGVIKSLLLRKRIELSPIFLSSDVCQKLSKDLGSSLNLKRCINCSLKKLMRSGRGRTLCFLNSGSVCAL